MMNTVVVVLVLGGRLDDKSGPSAPPLSYEYYPLLELPLNRPLREGLFAITLADESSSVDRSSNTNTILATINFEKLAQTINTAVFPDLHFFHQIYLHCILPSLYWMLAESYYIPPPFTNDKLLQESLFHQTPKAWYRIFDEDAQRYIQDAWIWQTNLIIAQVELDACLHLEATYDAICREAHPIYFNQLHRLVRTVQDAQSEPAQIFIQRKRAVMVRGRFKNSIEDLDDRITRYNPSSSISV